MRLETLDYSEGWEEVLEEYVNQCVTEVLIQDLSEGFLNPLSRY